MYIILLCLERNLKLLDLQMGDEEFIGFVFINDRSYGQGMNPPPPRFQGGQRILKLYIFWRPSLCKFLGGTCISQWDLVLSFLAHKLQHKQLTFYFLVFRFHKNLMKILYFPKNSSNIFYEILIFMQLSRNLDCQIMLYILLLATILDMTLKGLICLFSIKFISGW